MNKLKHIKRDSQKMKQSEATEDNQLCAVLHLNLLLTFVLRLEEQVKSQLGSVAIKCLLNGYPASAQIPCRMVSFSTFSPLVI